MIKDRFDVRIKLVVFLVALVLVIFSVFNILAHSDIGIYHLGEHFVKLWSLFKRGHHTIVGGLPLFNQLDQHRYAGSMALFHNHLVVICFLKTEFLRKSYKLRPSRAQP